MPFSIFSPYKRLVKRYRIDRHRMPLTSPLWMDQQLTYLLANGVGCLMIHL
jgi:hypothetical protein